MPPCLGSPADAGAMAAAPTAIRHAAASLRRVTYIAMDLPSRCFSAGARAAPSAIVTQARGSVEPDEGRMVRPTSALGPPWFGCYNGTRQGVDVGDAGGTDGQVANGAG